MYKKELDQAYFENKLLKDKNDKLNQDINSYTARIGILDAQITALHDTIKSLNDKNAAQQDQINKLLMERSKNENRPSQSKEESEALHKKNQQLGYLVQDYKEQNKYLCTQIALYAVKKQDNQERMYED